MASEPRPLMRSAIRWTVMAIVSFGGFLVLLAFSTVLIVTIVTMSRPPHAPQ
jgi:hypothetical protein